MMNSNALPSTCLGFVQTCRAATRFIIASAVLMVLPWCAAVIGLWLFPAYRLEYGYGIVVFSVVALVVAILGLTLNSFAESLHDRWFEARSRRAVARVVHCSLEYGELSPECVQAQADMRELYDKYTPGALRKQYRI